MKKKISIVTPCYNEQDNVEALFERVQQVFQTKLAHYDWEHIFIDNCSTDKTQEVLRKMASQNPQIRLIFNSRNFGHIRSPYYGLMQATGDAVILVVADLQDPPELLPDFVTKWEEGFKIVVGTKRTSEESSVFFTVRKVYYRILTYLSEIPMIENYTGFGLYDKRVLEVLRGINDPYPFFRGLICEIGFDKAIIPYDQPVRKRGFSKNNLYTLYDIGILGITSHSKKPLRLAIVTGFALSFLSLFLTFGYLALKIFFWESFSLGMAPLIMGLFFFSSVQLMFLGVIGEYIGNIYIKVINRPIVVEKERINF